MTTRREGPYTRAVGKASGETLKRRIVGGGALAVLLVLAGVAFWPRQPGAASSPTGIQPAAPSPDLPQGGVTETLPTLPPRGKEITEITATLEDVHLSPQARLMAERLVCVCGCNDILSTCNCKETPGSRDMKTYLQELVSGGKSPSEVEAAMVARYGEKVIPP
ncbi:MAG: cytochrome c-type biogenesis protein [Candidatus Polarisedimenticolia bacterium]